MTKTQRAKKIRVLIVDDSAIVRDLLAQGLSLDPEIEVIGKATDAWSARDRIVLLQPDVITLDIEMPGMDGIEFLRRLLPQYPIPVLVVSSVTPEGSRRALEALKAGAIDVVAKPDAKDREGFAAMLAELVGKLKEATHADISKLRKLNTMIPTTRRPIVTAPARKSNTQARPAQFNGNGVNCLVAIGASTGGTAVLNTIIPQFPAHMPGVVIVQHMPPVFTRLFAESLNRTSAMEVREAVNGDIVQQGLVLIAPGDFHMRVRKHGLQWRIECTKGEKVSGHRPSVDVLFHSVAEVAGDRAIGVILTGMGKDGSAGLLAMRRNGAQCIAQDEETSVVFGMPKEAYENGAARKLVPVSKLTTEILFMIAHRTEKRSVP